MGQAGEGVRWKAPGHWVETQVHQLRGGAGTQVTETPQAVCMQTEPWRRPQPAGLLRRASTTGPGRAENSCQQPRRRGFCKHTVSVTKNATKIPQRLKTDKLIRETGFIEKGEKGQECYHSPLSLLKALGGHLVPGPIPSTSHP